MSAAQMCGAMDCLINLAMSGCAANVLALNWSVVVLDSPISRLISRMAFRTRCRGMPPSNLVKPSCLSWALRSSLQAAIASVLSCSTAAATAARWATRSAINPSMSCADPKIRRFGSSRLTILMLVTPFAPRW